MFSEVTPEDVFQIVDMVTGHLEDAFVVVAKLPTTAGVHEVESYVVGRGDSKRVAILAERIQQGFTPIGISGYTVSRRGERREVQFQRKLFPWMEKHPDVKKAADSALEQITLQLRGTMAPPN